MRLDAKGDSLQGEGESEEVADDEEWRLVYLGEADTEVWMEMAWVVEGLKVGLVADRGAESVMVLCG